MPATPTEEVAEQVQALASALRELSSVCGEIATEAWAFERRANLAATAIDRGKSPREVDVLGVVALLDKIVEEAERKRGLLVEAERAVGMAVTDVRSARGESV